MFVNARVLAWRDGAEGTEHLVQTRDRPAQPVQLEFPGGTAEANESLIDALCREVHEETGPDVVEGQSVRHESDRATAECAEIFPVYQTTDGFNGMTAAVLRMMQLTGLL